MSRIKPQLIRKRVDIQLPKTIKVVVQPSKSKAANLHRIKQTRANSSVIHNSIKNHKQPLNAAISQKGLRRKRSLRKGAQVTYTRRNISQQSIDKINKLRNIGKGKLLIVIGNGPSISEVELEKLKNHSKIDTLSINKPDERLWPTTHWAFFDPSQQRRHEALWENYKGNVFNSTGIKKQNQGSMQFKNVGGKGFSKNAADGIHIGRSSTYATMQIAMWMNYEQIYLFGIDMNPDGLNGKLHFYGDNPDVEPRIRKTRFKNEAIHYDYAATILSDDDRNRYTFCTEYNQWDFIKKFRSMSHKLAVDHILSHAKKL